MVDRRGALKSNLGHLEGASGIAGVIKATLVLENGIIPPNTNFENLNPRIRADLLNLKVCIPELIHVTILALIPCSSLLRVWLGRLKAHGEHL
jgi:hypothetical protein